MVLGSDVPLTEDILKKPIEFVNSWVEWAAKTKIQELFDTFSNSGGANEAMFTVPLNQILYITSAWVNVSHNSGVAGLRLSSILLSGQENDVRIIRTQTRAVDSSSALSLTYPTPIKVNEGVAVTFLNSNNSEGSAGFQGFLIDKSLT